MPTRSSLHGGYRVHELRTERLHLRRAIASDLTTIHAIMSDPAVMRFWSTLPHSQLAETEVWLAAMLAADAAQDSDEFVIEHHGVLIGKLGVWRHPELGFFLSRDSWGRGFATEALQAYIAYVKWSGSHELTADVDPRNADCLRLLERCGFVETGRETATYLVDGRPCDSVYLHLDVQSYSAGGKAR